MDEATIRGNGTFMPDMEEDILSTRKGMPSGGPEIESTDFILRGEVYKRLECLSGNSGEAQVFLVEKDGEKMVLKIYYPNFKIKKEVTKIVMNMRFEMIINIIDFGKVYLEGANRDYELMEYLQGGTFENYNVHGDMNKFRRIALQTAAALKYCHNRNIIHKDIKPGNFFFRDETHEEVVLGDFGISSLLSKKEELHRTTQARTPLYASPEMYNDVIDGVVEISQATDYYSLGLTLMTIWMGHAPFNVGERTIMRQKNNGRIPGMDSLPERVKLLISGLTTVNASSRWTYDEVEQWFNGETPSVDIKSPFLKYKSFVVDPDRNLVAENIEELVPMLIENERIAIGYLYSGSLANWFDSCGNTKVSTELRDIVANKYAGDHHAGFMAAVYAMDPTLPYVNIAGQKCTDAHSLATSILIYAKEYSVMLRNPYDKFWVYVDSHFDCNVNRMRGYFESSPDADMSVPIQRVAFEIDTELPFIHQKQSSTIQEIVSCFGSGDVTENDWISLVDGRLLSWMYGHADAMACEALRIMTKGQQYSRQLAYKVLYDIDREAAYDLREADTPAKVGELMHDNLIRWQNLSDEDFENKISEYSDPNGRFAFYAQLHGWSVEYEQLKRCFDMNSEENRERLSAYDLRTAAYRFCCILGVKPQYMLQSGKILKNEKINDRRLYNDIRPEIRSGSFKQWLSVYYHENPDNDFEEAYSYERALEKWLTVIGDIDPQQPYFRRYSKAKQDTKKKTDEFKTEYNKATSRASTWKMVCGGVFALWIILLIICGVSGREYLLENGVITICGPVGIVSAVLLGFRGFFTGYGTLLIILCGIVGFCSSLIPLWILRGVQDAAPGFFIPTTILLSILYYFICIKTDGSTKASNEKEMIKEAIDDDVKSSLLEPLYYTFKTKSAHFRGSKFGVMENVSDHYTSSANDAFIHYLLWSIMVILLLVEMIVFSPKLLNVDNPTSGLFQVSPTSVIEQLQKDVE